jgi:hypothetical protein
VRRFQLLPPVPFAISTSVSVADYDAIATSITVQYYIHCCCHHFLLPLPVLLPSLRRAGFPLQRFRCLIAVPLPSALPFTGTIVSITFPFAVCHFYGTLGGTRLPYFLD